MFIGLFSYKCPRLLEEKGWDIVFAFGFRPSVLPQVVGRYLVYGTPPTVLL